MRAIKFPPKSERWAIVIAALFGIIWFIVTSLTLQSGSGVDVWKHSLWSGFEINGMTIFWVSIIIYHLALVFLIVRSLVVGDRDFNNLDYSVGFFGILGVFCIIVSVISGIYLKEEFITYLFNVNTALVYNLGVLMQVFAVLYYSITE